MREGEDGYEQTETQTRCAETTREACTEEEKKKSLNHQLNCQCPSQQKILLKK